MINKMMNVKYAIIGTFTLITACNKAPSFADLCDQHPKICSEFKENSWRKRERIVVGFANLEHKKPPKTHKNLINSLVTKITLNV